jgi:hypothetical protein
VGLALLTDEPEIRGSRLGGSPSFPTALPKTRRGDAERRRRAAFTCDFCRSAFPRGERHRLVWESAVAGELVLAEICSRCAAKSFGSAHGASTSQPDTLRLVQAVESSAPAHRVVAFVAHGVLYLVIAVTFFLIVTLISSSAH